MGAGREYFAFNAIILNIDTVGACACAGCLVPVCSVHNSIGVEVGTSQPEFLVAGTSAASNFASWQGLGPNCRLVPTKRTTWSSVKRLYR